MAAGRNVLVANAFSSAMDAALRRREAAHFACSECRDNSYDPIHVVCEKYSTPTKLTETVDVIEQRPSVIPPISFDRSKSEINIPFGASMAVFATS